MFCVISKPLCEAEAVAGAVASAIFFIGASICTYLGVTFATNADAQKALSDWFYGLGDDIKNMVEGYAKNWVSGYNTICEWEASGWRTICNSIADFFTINYYEPSGVGIEINASGSQLGFTSDTSFTFTIPEHQPNTTFNINCGKSTITIIDNTQLKNIITDYYGFFSDSDYQALIDDSSKYCRFYGVKNSEGLEWFFIDWYWNSYNSPEYTFVYPGTLSSNYPSDYSFCNGALLFDSNTRSSIRLFSNKFSNERCNYKDGDGNFYNIQQLSNGKYAFVCVVSDNVNVPNLFGLEFDTAESACSYFASKCGFILPIASSSDKENAGTYTPGDTKLDVYINKDRLESKVDEANNLADDSTFQTVLPGTQEYLDEMVANPDLVTDVAAEGVYNADIPAIKSDPILWQTKFPFCLPFDLYNLFTGFNATAAAPVWPLLVLPENSVGMDNEAIYFDIDFGANGLDTFVKYMRFFIAASFVVWLILISRKLIGGE